MSKPTRPELERVITELINLGRRKPLPTRDLEKAKQFMRRLREMGYTNAEISELTDGCWSESTAKLYTRGTTVEDPGPKKRATELLARTFFSLYYGMHLAIAEKTCELFLTSDSDFRNVTEVKVEYI